MNNIYFVQKGGASEPAVLCEDHARRIEPFDAVSEPMDESDEPCVVCLARAKDELLEIATELIDADGSGMLPFLRLLAGLLEARTGAGDETEIEDIFRAALGGVDRAIENVVEILFDKFDAGDPVVFARDVHRPPHYVIPARATGRVERIAGGMVTVTLDRAVRGEGADDLRALLFDDKEEFLHAVRKLRPPD